MYKLLLVTPIYYYISGANASEHFKEVESMSYATTICPECGAVNKHTMEGSVSVDQFCDGKTKCACGHEYENFPNVSLHLPEEEVSTASN